MSDQSPKRMSRKAFDQELKRLWYRVKADDKRSARLNCISHLLGQIPFEPPTLCDRRKRRADVPDTVAFTRAVPEVF